MNNRSYEQKYKKRKNIQGKKEKMKKRRYQKRAKRIKKIIIYAVFISIFFLMKKEISFWFNKIITNKDHHEIGTPEKRSEQEVYNQLSKLAQKDKKVAAIYKAREQYPVELLSMLVNNPEMTDFVYNYPEAEEENIGNFTGEDLNKKFPLLLQWDERWGYASYGDSIIAIAGCGPTSLSMVILSLTCNEDATPYQLAQYSVENGYYVNGTGTSWNLMTDGVRSFGLIAEELPLSENTMKQELDKGHPIICAMGVGDFTTSGHFIVIYGYDANGFQINDPNCIGRSKKSWDYETISTQIRNLWAYSVL